MTDESSALEQPYEIVSVRRAKPPPDAKGTNWHRYVIALQHSRLPTRGSQGRDEGGGGNCRPIERTTLGQTQPRPPGVAAEEENPRVVIDLPSCRSDLLVAML